MPSKTDMKKIIAVFALLSLLMACGEASVETGSNDPSPTQEAGPSSAVAGEEAPTPSATTSATGQQLPSILITKPTMGERISSPVQIEGTADVFEATVQMRLLDAHGEPLARAFTTATCGSGCRGDFAHQLEFEIDEEQQGVVEGWWESPEDGSRKDVVQIPVTLVP